VIHNFGSSFSRKYDVELLPTATKSLASAGYPRQVHCDELQDLVAGVVTVSVVEPLEVIDIDHRDRIRMLQAQKRVVESAAGGQGCEFIVISQQVRVLHDRSRKDAGRSDRVYGRDSGVSGEAQRQEERGQRPQQSAVDRLADEFRRRGVAYTSDFIPGISGVAAPVFDYSGAMTLALVALGYSKPFEAALGKISTAVVNKAAILSKRLGYNIQQGET